MDTSKINLVETIRNLRSQLQKAMEESEGANLQFEMEDIEIELKCGITREGGVNGGVNFWVFETGAEVKTGDEKTLTIKMRLKPVTKDGRKLRLSDTDRI